ncbi:nidogen-like domain-containing protein [Chitinimonas sp. BJB300]|uniref:nidogen-like domain-containing protein n=1 Tax=Chitinimonas sp. BJB300 TaxID=1559339 RepID=UPI000C1172E8|nr:nidogen-like domain-containing protein [Chitinimonas sp. BJB300]PHV12700.1 VPLPA-CTERM sorting domain-containing protein [Chitinimonas sp. BJB300]TSJ91255.1 PEP-CTERM sorting domain-containing protein [Chitinimonas sp. BJB300]
MRLFTHLFTVALTLVCASTNAAAIRDSNLFNDVALAANDDNSTGLVDIGFNVDFYSMKNMGQLYVNNNGNVTFLNKLSAFSPSGLGNISFPILAPFFADVDTRATNSGVVRYGTDTIAGHKVFGVNWIDVGYFNRQGNKLNSFQLILTDRSETGLGNFDIEFNYDKILWETGSASDGINGIGGKPATVGYTDGGTNNYEFFGSRTTRAFLDDNPTGLIHGSLNSDVNGRYIFNVRDGQVTHVPEPTTAALLGLGLLAGFAFRRKRS